MQRIVTPAKKAINVRKNKNAKNITISCSDVISSYQEFVEGCLLLS